MTEPKNYKSFPFLSTFYFWNRIGKTGKKLFWIALATVFISGIYAIIPTFFPFDFFVPYHSYAEHFIDHVSIKKSEEGFPIELFAPIYYNFQVIVADKILIHWIPVLIYLVFFSIGWSLLLAVSSKIEGFIFYLIYFLFGSTMVFSQSGLCLFGEDPYRLSSLFITSIFIILAYRYKNSEQSYTLYSQFFRFLLIFVIYFLSVFIFQGKKELFHFAFYSYPISTIITLIFIVWTSKDLAFAIILWATNRKEAKDRKDVELIYFLILLLFLLGLYWSLGLYYDWKLPKIVSPIWILWISGMISFLSSLAFYAEVQEEIAGNLPFILLHQAIAIIAFSYIGFMGFNAEPLNVYQVERYYAYFLCTFSLGTLLYLIFNFHRLLKLRTNIFFVLSQPNTLSFKAIVLACLAGLVLSEGKQRWRSAHILMSAYFNQLADYHLVIDDTLQASNHYLRARAAAIGNPKANYNYSSLNLQNESEKFDAVQILKASNAVIPFDAPQLNIGFHQSKPRNAINYYLSQKKLSDKIYNNLGYFYFKINNLDSAIICWKKALELNSNLTEAYCNLAVLYAISGKKEWAKKMAKYIPPDMPSVHHQENLLYLSMLLDTHLVSMRNFLHDSLYALNYNQAIVQLKYQDPQKTIDLVKKLEKQFDNEYLPFAYLKMFSYLWQGNVFAGQDMARYIAEIFPDYQKQVWHTVGSFYYFWDMPEMAIDPFRKAENALDSLNALFMQLLAGHHDISINSLDIAKAELPAYKEKIRHELALLFKAYELDDLQQIEWDFSGITYSEALRGAKYATMADKIKSTEFFLSLLKNFKNHPQTWIQIMESFIHFQDKRMLAAADSALFFYPKHPEILAIAEYIYTLQQKNSNAFPQITLSSDKILYYKAKTAYQLKDYAKAQEYLQKIFHHNPYHADAVVLMADIYMALNQSDKEFDFLSKALVKNEKSYKLWYRYYQYNRRYKFRDELQTSVEYLSKYAPSLLFERIKKDYMAFQDSVEKSSIE